LSWPRWQPGRPPPAALGHDGALPGYASIAPTSRHGRRQAVVLVDSITEPETVGNRAGRRRTRASSPRPTAA